MTRAEFIALASPPCHECGVPIDRVEVTHERIHLDNASFWAVKNMFMVCTAGHRTEVEPFDRII